MTQSGERDAASDRSRQDPRVGRSRAAIVTGATDVFLAQGYERTSIDVVAAASGVAKRTVYNIFGDKERLFREVLREALDTAQAYAERLSSVRVDPSDTEGVLLEVARDLVQSIVASRVVPLRRLLIGEAAQFSELATDYYERAPGLVMRALADVLRCFHDAGALHVPDPARAGEHFAFLTIGATLDRSLFHLNPVPDALAIALERADSGVRAFLRAYAPSPGSQGSIRSRLTG